MYSPPYTPEEIRLHYPDKAETLLRDPVHLWRATTGIELVHEEPTPEEQARIWENWQAMDAGRRAESDRKSLELFGLTNRQHHERILAGRSD